MGETHNSSQGQTALTDMMGLSSALGHEMAVSNSRALAAEEFWLGQSLDRKASERAFQKDTSTEMN